VSQPDGTPPGPDTGDGAALPRGVYARLALHIFDHPRGWSAGIVLLTLLCVLLGKQMTINPNILDLLPSEDPTTRAIQKINAEEGGSNLLTIAIKGDDPAKVDAYARETAATLRQMEGVDYALYDIEPELAWRIGLLQLSVEELGLLRERLSAALALGPAAANPFIASRLMDMGPLTEKLGQRDAATAFTGVDGAARILVRPTGSAYDPVFARPFLKQVRQTLDATDPAGHGVRIAWLGGAHRHAVDELETIIHDLGSTTLVSTGLIVALLVLAFRQLRALQMILVPLFTGTIWAWGFAAVSVGTINSFTSFSGAIVIGLGIDFCIHLYSRYREERRQTGDTRLAIARAWQETAPPCFTAAITTAAGFVALLVASFQGFRQLGIILSAGVMLCFLAAVVVLPLLLRFADGKGGATPPGKAEAAPGPIPSYRLGPPGLLGLALLTVAAGFTLPKMGFEYDLSELRSQGMAYEDLSEEARALAIDSFSPVVVSYPDAESLAADHTRLSEAVATGALPEIKRVLSIHSLLPIDQADRVAILKEISTLSRSENVKFLPASLQQNLAHFAAHEPSLMATADLPRELQHVLGASEGHHRLLLMPQGNMWDLRADHDLALAIERWCPGREAANEYLASNVLYRLMNEDAPVVAGLAILLVAALTWLDLRNVSRTVVAMAALGAGACWAGAGMVLFGIKVSIVNFVGIPILLGIGMDVIVHLLHRIETEGPGGVWRAMRTTGFAAGISTTNNVLSFVALLAAANQGVKSLGEMIVIGLTLMTLAGFVVVPFFWMTVWRLRKMGGAD
jgi:predicted exporter